MNRILITGSNGFIGSHLIDLLIKKNQRIYALNRPSSSNEKLIHYTNDKIRFLDEDKIDFCGERILIPSKNKNLTFLDCDIKNAPLLEKIIMNIKPEYIFHFAAQPYIIPK